MNEIANKRTLMEATHNLIPNMDEVEIQALAITMANIIEHMIKRGIKVSEE